MKTMKSVKRLAFERNVLPHLDELWRTALWLTMRRTDAEDLVLKSISKAYRLWHSSPDTLDNKAWLFRILVREIADAGYRKQHGRGFLPEKGKIVASWNYVDGQHQFESIHRSRLSVLAGVSGMHVNGAIARLRPQSRLLMLLLFRERFSYADIAYITDLREESVKSILRRLRRLVPRYLVRHVDSFVTVEGACATSPVPWGLAGDAGCGG